MDLILKIEEQLHVKKQITKYNNFLSFLYCQKYPLLYLPSFYCLDLNKYAREEMNGKRVTKTSLIVCLIFQRSTDDELIIESALLTE